MTNPEAASPETTTALRVDAETCMGCMACVHDFAQLFETRGDKAVVRQQAALQGLPLRRVVQCCPVDAISVPAKEGTQDEVKSLPVVEGWEAAWSQQRDEPEDLVERERRYGRVLHLKVVDGGWRLRVELPRSIPNHRLVFMFGFEREPPEYDFIVDQIGPAILSIRGRLVGPKLRFLTGKINSFPNTLKVDFTFPAPVDSFYRRQVPGGIDLYAFREGIADPVSHLRQVLLAQKD